MLSAVEGGLLWNSSSRRRLTADGEPHCRTCSMHSFGSAIYNVAIILKVL
ncbi:hypothetical protein JMA_11110 [Jeotgalibacillus malaysiensis]|uniref:Uncharacterized protein n=1 Tax=Jeotgalibacillus malaysiensis TaxID=1508404 RepID=A0A0B5APK4_9BACL|nr:hypothetical protein JMA_11110 [Jeotgalibacillus malaysiensis]